MKCYKMFTDNNILEICFIVWLYFLEYLWRFMVEHLAALWWNHPTLVILMIFPSSCTLVDVQPCKNKDLQPVKKDVNKAGIRMFLWNGPASVWPEVFISLYTVACCDPVDQSLSHSSKLVNSWRSNPHYCISAVCRLEWIYTLSFICQFVCTVSQAE